MKIKFISIMGLLCLFVISLFSFTPTASNSSLSGEALAKQYCGSCHLYTAPDLLDKKTWKESKLPHMGWRLGIRGVNDSPYAEMEPDEAAIVEKLRVYPNSPIISKSDWQKIVDFYITKAPATVVPAKTTNVVKTFYR